MRFIVLPVVLALGTMAFSSGAFAKRKYGMAGCGLGSIVIGPNGGQIFAGTTNGTFGSQSFGISAGTSNCKPEKATVAIIEQEQFLSVNLKTLQKEMAQGGGRTVTAFSEVMGCKGPAIEAAAKVLVDSHDSVFAQPGIENVRDNATAQLNNNNETATGCDRLVL